MRKLSLVVVALATALAIGAPSAEATPVLSFVPQNQTVQVGQNVNVDVWFAFGDANEAALGLGDFDLDVLLSNFSVVNFTGWTLGPFLGDVNFFEAFDLSTGDNGAGLIDLAEVSLMPFGDLVALQPDTGFALATLSFTAAQVGSTNLDFTQSILGDGNGIGMNASLTSGTINVVAGTVPEPTALMLLGTALAGLAGRRLRSLTRR